MTFIFRHVTAINMQFNCKHLYTTIVEYFDYSTIYLEPCIFVYKDTDEQDYVVF
jgi:hypothetical protein